MEYRACLAEFPADQPPVSSCPNSRHGLDEVIFATPSFVAEFRCAVVPSILEEQWHLENRAKVTGQKKGEDVKAARAWTKRKGKASIVVAVPDNGVDVDHTLS